MNTSETKKLMLDFSRVVGNKAFFDWRQKAIDDAVAVNGTTDEVEWAAQLASWQRTLQGVSYDEGLAVVWLMETRVVSVPIYGEWARTIDQCARAARTTPSYQTDERRLECLVCMDSGMVHIWNPRFVEAYRDRFEEMLPPGWEGDASRWWRAQEKGPRVHMVRCNCSCHRSRIFAEEQDKFRDGTRRDITNKPAGPPACGMAVYDPRVMPLKTIKPVDDLRDWYKSHTPSQVYEWQPS